MTRYPYRLERRDDDLLDAEIQALALPGYHALHTSGDWVHVEISNDLSILDRERLNAAIAAHTGTPRRPKGFPLLFQEVLAHLGTDQARIRKAVAFLLTIALREDPKAYHRMGENLSGDEPIV